MPNLMLIGAGINQLPVIEEAHKLGVKVLALDARKDAEGFALSEWHECVDIKDLFHVKQIAKAYNKEAKKLHGEFARLNEISEGGL